MYKNNMQIQKSLLRKPYLRGAAMAETIIVFPIMMFIGMGIVHLGLIYQAKTNLEYASFMAARQAASTELASLPDDGDADNCDGWCEIKMTVRCRMSAYDPLPAGVACDGTDLPATELAKVEIQIIRPAQPEFDDWGETASGNSCTVPQIGCYIPNDGLLGLNPTATGSSLGLNIHDANIMTISVRYLVDTGVPFINGFFIGEAGPTNMEDLVPDKFVDDPFGRSRNRPGVWITAESSMVMQSRATITNANLCGFTGYC